MRKVILGISVLFTTLVWGQQPEKVYSFVQEMREVDWYKTQENLWAAEIKKNDKNGEAWLNYYRCIRNLRYQAPHETDTYNQEAYDIYNKKCDDAVVNVQKAMPNSFEALVIKSSHLGVIEGREFLLKAEKLRPFDPQITDELLIHYDLVRDMAKKKKYAEEMYRANDMAVGHLNWGYNILSELDENAILFTFGDNDTYATWIVQETKNYRKDVTIINDYLIVNDAYRNKILKELGYAPLDISLEKAQSNEELAELKVKLYKHFFAGKRPVYTVNTGCGNFLKNFENEFYLTGLANKYSAESFDNLAIIKRNYEKRYLLDYLKESFAYNISNKNAEGFNGMYLPMIIKLYQHYKQSEDGQLVDELEPVMIAIATQNEKLEEVKTIIKK